MTKIVAGIAALAAFALGGATLAGATGGGNDSEGPEQRLTGSTLAQASAAALKATGGGEVNQTERDSENGATYEVEVTKPDGSTVDVRLDESFAVVVIEGDSEDEGAGENEQSGENG